MFSKHSSTKYVSGESWIWFSATLISLLCVTSSSHFHCNSACRLYVSERTNDFCLATVSVRPTFVEWTTKFGDLLPTNSCRPVVYLHETDVTTKTLLLLFVAKQWFVHTLSPRTWHDNFMQGKYFAESHTEDDDNVKVETGSRSLICRPCFHRSEVVISQPWIENWDALSKFVNQIVFDVRRHQMGNRK